MADAFFMRGFGARLRRARKQARFASAKSFAQSVGIEEATYRRYERGEVLPAYDRLAMIAEALDVDFKFLATGKKK